MSFGALRFERLSFPRDREILRSFHRMYDAEYDFHRKAGEEEFLLDTLEKHQDIYHCLVLFEGDAPVGYIRGYDRISTSSCDVVFMLDLVYVHPDHRGRGVGKELIARLLDHVHRSGAARIDLLADVGNEVAQRLYRGFGFQGRVRYQMHRFLKAHEDLSRYFDQKAEAEAAILPKTQPELTPLPPKGRTDTLTGRSTEVVPREEEEEG